MATGFIDFTTMDLGLLGGRTLTCPILVCAWAAIYDRDGVLWGYGSASDLLGDGDFKLQETLLLQGAFARLTIATIQGVRHG